MDDNQLIKQLLGAAVDIIISGTIFVFTMITDHPHFYIACLIEVAWMCLNMFNVYNCIKVNDVNSRESYIMGFCSVIAATFAIALLFFGILYTIEQYAD